MVIVHAHKKRPGKGAPETFETNEKRLKEFNDFMERICSLPVLALPCPNVQYTVNTDAF